MSDEIDKHKIQELKEMIRRKDPKEPAEKVLAIFCERHGVSLATCRILYNQLVDRGDIKEK